MIPTGYTVNPGSDKCAAVPQEAGENTTGVQSLSREANRLPRIYFNGAAEFGEPIEG